MKKIVVLGTNPAWQKTLSFEHFQPGEVNRATAVKYFASGKGINLARATRINGSARPVVVQFAGGDTGRALTAALSAEGIAARSTPTAGATRGCTTCLCRTRGVMTELIEPSATPELAEVLELLQTLREELKNAAGLAITGTLPGQLDSALYRNAVNLANAAGLPVLIDAWKGLDEVLPLARQAMVKINLEELYTLTAARTPTAAMRELLERYALRGLGITAGARTAYWLEPDGELWRFEPPVLEQIVSPLGCGDTVSGIFFSEFLTGQSAPEAFARGLAAAAANCLNDFCGHYDRQTAKNFRQSIRMSTTKE